MEAWQDPWKILKKILDGSWKGLLRASEGPLEGLVRVFGRFWKGLGTVLEESWADLGCQVPGPTGLNRFLAPKMIQKLSPNPPKIDGCPGTYADVMFIPILG